MADWETISSLATGAGTLVLAVATFAAVRSSNRSARIAEIALQEQRRPLLAGSRLGVDPDQKIMFVDRALGTRRRRPRHGRERGRSDLSGDEPAQHRRGDRRMSGWGVRAGLLRTRRPLSRGRVPAQTRDLYIPAGDVGLWQGAIRDRTIRSPRDRARDLPARADHGRAPLLRPDRRSAHDHPIHAGAARPRRRRRGDSVDQRRSALVPGSRRAALTRSRTAAAPAAISRTISPAGRA